MLTQEDKQWFTDLLDQRLAGERSITNTHFAEMRDFIIEGRRQDRAWVKEELDSLKRWTIDFQEDFARTVAVGFNEVHAHINKLEHPQTVPLF